MCKCGGKCKGGENCSCKNKDKKNGESSFASDDKKTAAIVVGIVLLIIVGFIWYRTRTQQADASSNET